MTDFIQTTLNAGLQIARSLNARMPNLYAKHARGAGGDISIGADLLSEEIFITQLSAFGNIDSEEAGFIDNKKAHTIVIDPLDGSDNFLSQIPYYGASVALKNANSSSRSDFLGSASARFVDEPCVLSSSLASHNPKNSSAILEFAHRAENAESSGNFAESNAESRLDSANVGIIMNFCNLSAVVSFRGKNYYGNLAQDFSQFAESSADSVNFAKCGIFEGAYRNPRICEILHKNNIKFRSLGALALSLGISERVNFVLFDGKKRHYDFEAGFLVAQNLHKIEGQNLVLISKDKILFDKISNLLF